MFLDIVRNSLGRLDALRDIKSIQKREQAALRTAGKRAIERAQLALRHGERAAAEQIWVEVCRNFPQASMSAAGLYLLLDLHRYEELDELVRTGLEKEPHRPDLLELSAVAAKRRGQSDEAMNLYGIIQRKYPRLVQGHLGRARCLISLGRYDEAEEVFARVRRRFLDDEAFCVEDARLAVARKDWAAGLQRWTRVWQLDRNRDRRVEAAVAIARCHRESGDLHAAELCLLEARDQYRPISQLWIELAEIAEATGDWGVATKRWADVYLRFPSQPLGYLRGTHALVQCGRDQEAAALVRSAAERFPSDSRFRTDLAQLCAAGLGKAAAPKEVDG